MLEEKPEMFVHGLDKTYFARLLNNRTCSHYTGLSPTTRAHRGTIVVVRLTIRAHKPSALTGRRREGRVASLSTGTKHLVTLCTLGISVSGVAMTYFI